MNEHNPTTVRSIRMNRCSDQTLIGYIFSDKEHARRWLSQSFVKAEDVDLQEVEVTPLKECPYCRGSGSRQRVTAGRKLTLGEFLKEAVDGE